MKEVDCWYMSYYNVETKVKGIVILDSQPKAEKYMNDLGQWKKDGQNTYTCMKITGPHKHRIS